MSTEKPVTIGLAAPASSFDTAKFNESVHFLNSLGFKVILSPSIFEKKGYLAGSDELRAAELNALFANKEIDVIMCVRGGYGSARMISLLNLDLIKANPKPFIAASDICSILFLLENHTSIPLFFGPFAIEIKADMDKESLELLLKVIRTGNAAPYEVSGLTTVVGGKVSANVTGGCLTIIQASLKTPYEIDTDGKILFIEDTDEALYRVDRALTHLKLAGKLNKIKGVIAGIFAKSNFTINQLGELLLDIFKEYSIPIVMNFPAGHGNKKLVIPFKKDILLDADAGIVKYYTKRQK